MKTHRLKVHPCYWLPLFSGMKKFEIRYNDRDYEVGDALSLSLPGFGHLPATWMEFSITYMTDFPDGLKPGYIVLGIERRTKDTI